MQISENEFEEKVLKSELPVLVDFFATWCGPCKMMAPIVEAIEKEMEGKANVYKIDTDEATDLAMKYNIMSIPTFLIFKNGEVVNTVVGMKDKQELIDLLS